MKKILCSIFVIVAFSASVASAGELELANLEIDSTSLGTENNLKLSFDLTVIPPVTQTSIGILTVDPLGTETLICSSYSPPGQFPGTYSLGHSVDIPEEAAEGTWTFTAISWQLNRCADGFVPDASQSITFFIDQSGPEIELELSDEPLILNGDSSLITISDGATGSGIDWERSDIVGAVSDGAGNLVLDTSTAGLNQLIIHAYDFVGNESTAIYEYEVFYDVEGVGVSGSLLLNTDLNDETIDGEDVDGSYQSGELIEVAFTLSDAAGEFINDALVGAKILTASGELITDEVVFNFNNESDAYELSLDTNGYEAGIYELEILLSDSQEISLFVAIDGEAGLAAGGGVSQISFGM